MSAHVVVIDSGIGGTSVMAHLLRVPTVSAFSYIMDNRHLPYGDKPKAFIEQRLITLVEFALTLKPAPKLIVIACNTASTQTLTLLRERFTIPFVGVVPAIKPAAERYPQQPIAILATPATIAQQYTQQLIQNFAAQHELHLIGSKDLVFWAEQKFWLNADVSAQVQGWLSAHPFLKQCAAIVLGCTHFPILAKELTQGLGTAVELVDSGSAIAKRVANLLLDEVARAAEEVATVSYYASAAIAEGDNKTGLQVEVLPPQYC